MQIEPSYISCGIMQLHGLAAASRMSHQQQRDWKKSLSNLVPRLYNKEANPGCTCPFCAQIREKGGRSRCRFVIFSDADAFRNGIEFAKFLTDSGFRVTEVCEGKNPNTGSHIRLWSWELPDYPDMESFLESK